MQKIQIGMAKNSTFLKKKKKAEKFEIWAGMRLKVPWKFWKFEIWASKAQ